MKYVVDIPESMVIKSALKGLTLWITMKVPSNNQDFVIPTNIQLEPYTEPDIYSHTDNPTGWELYQDYQKAKERYETWKNYRDEIHVGDEVIHNGEIKTVLGVLLGVLTLYDSDGFIYYINESDVKKTGKHHGEVAELLKKMRGKNDWYN